MAVCSPLVIVAAIPALFVWWKIRLTYMSTGRELKRLEANARSPLLSILLEALQGSALIHAHRLRPYFIQRYEAATTEHTTMALHLYLILPWLTFMLDMLGSLMLLAVLISSLAGIGSPVMTGDAMACDACSMSAWNKLSSDDMWK